MSEQLYWHCATCGAHEPVDNEAVEGAYERGDIEPCITCETGVARVVTAKEAARRGDV